jgi:hypothetical protein
MSRCITTEASHYERHLSIAILVNDVHGCGEGHQQTLGRKRKKAKKQGNESDLSTADESAATEISSIDSDPINEDSDVCFEPDENFMSPSERRALKRTMKGKRSQEKAFRNQQRFALYVSQTHVDQVAKAIHGATYNVGRIGGHPVAHEKDVHAIFERHDAYNAAIKDHRTWLKGQVRESRTRSGKKGKEAGDRQYQEDEKRGLLVEKQDVEELVTAILAQLGISDRSETSSAMTYTESPIANRSKKQKATTLLQLRKEIAADIEKSENDRRATQQRMEGYWRYVNGTVTNRLAENAQSVDRATGVKLKRDPGRHRYPRLLETDEAEDLEMEAGDGTCNE